MSRGEYIIFLAISDGIRDRNWFKKSVEILDREVSHVWGLSQNMMEDGRMGKLWFAEFLEHHPPQKMDFFPFWLATRHGVESNAVYRRNVFETCHPQNTPDELYRFHPTLGFNYNLNTKGYLQYFLPMISAACTGVRDRKNTGIFLSPYRKNMTMTSNAIGMIYWQEE